MVSLKYGNGKVPVRNSTEHEAIHYILVDFPTKAEFNEIYAKHKSQELKDKYWQILKHRSRGKTLDEAGKPFDVTRERVRQIEARFLRLVAERYWSKHD